MSIKTPITVAYGDGIGPEIMQATLDILQAADAQIKPEVIEVGEKVYLQGYTSGIPDQAWESLKRTKVLLKGPITTPQGGGYKSLNVTLRKTLGLFANVRPCVSYAPYVPTQFPHIDLVIIRENEEDLYAGIEHRQTDEVYQCLKIISRPGCEQIIRYAFEYAQKFNRKKVTCLSKDNIMKMTDGLFHRIFNEIAAQYPDIEHDHLIIDIGTALIASQPERFDVVVTLNLYGDIISDVAAQIVGSVGLAGSANIGNRMAMFEAIHGSAPDIAGKNIANPSGLLNAAVQMLVHINQPETATLVENAWLKTLEDGVHTGDIYSSTYSKQKVGTQAFAAAVIERLGQTPSHFKPANYRPGAYAKIECYGDQYQTHSKKELVGVDIFIDNSAEIPAAQLAAKLKQLGGPLELIVISSRGLKIWPDSTIDFPYLRHCCCRFQSSKDSKQLKTIHHTDILKLLSGFNELGLDVIKTENLYTFDGQLGFTLAQGQ
ncbi:NADP-dependent isocitrate dehydrogenase [Aquicella lusitana]|uniref:Isocitrate dehydrogenase [NADP] n=1 Tax=Aquicella lusitana TaxID=254246 RepID=A0A370GN53_9COXI|nr:NADP-dependent isocitrate dehydrogenase [Aquicella lusitana]RDI45165.1 isocitrate dehydrogenase [Aquicella lusitana]VVC72765.1 Isocitrate dehydrogenase [NADP] [Aquicella lusitana]